MELSNIRPKAFILALVFCLAFWQVNVIVGVMMFNVFLVYTFMFFNREEFNVFMALMCLSLVCVTLVGGVA